MEDNGRQSRSVRIRTRDAVGAGVSGTRDAAGAARIRADELIDQALDHVFDEPYGVSDAAAAKRMVNDHDKLRSWVVPEVLVGTVALWLVRWAPKMSRFVGPMTTLMLVAGARAGRVMQRGLLELRVLASFLISRARVEGLTLDKAFVRAVTVEIYLDPRRRIDFRYRGPNAGRAVVTRWVKDAASNPTDDAQQALAEDHIEAVAGLDLREVANKWGIKGASAENSGTQLMP